jgi:uncharacterized membrane protein YgdD (TMEM256/DUF423 family)
MAMNPKIWLVLAGILGASGVALGAYHAHGLEGWLTKQGLDSAEIVKRLHNCEVGVRYQMYHALALVGVAILAFRGNYAGLTAAGMLFLLGMLLFSGGLYWSVFSAVKIHWSIVPGGGLLLIIGWLALAVAGIRYQP